MVVVTRFQGQLGAPPHHHNKHFLMPLLASCSPTSHGSKASRKASPESVLGRVLPQGETRGGGMTRSHSVMHKGVVTPDMQIWTCNPGDADALRVQTQFCLSPEPIVAVCTCSLPALLMHQVGDVCLGGSGFPIPAEAEWPPARAAWAD